MLEVVEDGTHEDKTARSSIAKMGGFHANMDVFVVLAHDESLVDIVDSFPVSLNPDLAGLPVLDASSSSAFVPAVLISALPSPAGN
ncbi:hypothetical protein B0H12DRAFT_1233663 [Mycena haematopus]|nr:hypothetical protein B0H12DRAFT_1233663 [Mycena haematopus]